MVRECMIGRDDECLHTIALNFGYDMTKKISQDDAHF